MGLEPPYLLIHKNSQLGMGLEPSYLLIHKNSPLDMMCMTVHYSKIPPVQYSHNLGICTHPSSNHKSELYTALLNTNHYNIDIASIANMAVG